jgi:hypothetical protein
LALSEVERQARARMGGHAVRAQGKVNTVPARQAQLNKLLDQVDPDRILPEKERAKRAESARLLYFERLRFHRLKALRLKREAKKSP